MGTLKYRVVFLDPMMELDDTGEAVDILSKAGLSNITKCFSLSVPVIEILKDRYNSNISYEYALDYISQQDLEEIESRIWAWLCNWYNDKELGKYKEFIFYRDFPLPNFMDNELVNLLIYIMKNILAINKFIQRNKECNYALVLSKTGIYADLCRHIFEKQGIDYKVYNFSRSKDRIFNKPVFYNWGEPPYFKFALISTLYSLIEILSGLFRFIATEKKGVKRIIVMDHRVLRPAIDRLLERGYAVFLPNNIRMFLSRGGIKKRLCYINTFSSLKLDLINYITVKFRQRRSLSSAGKIYDKLLEIKENKYFFNFQNTDFSQVFKKPFMNMLKKLPVFAAACKKTDRKFKRNRFDLCVTSSSYGEARFYWYLCKFYGIINAGYMHGISTMKMFYNHNINRSEYLFLWGSKIKEEGLSRGEFQNKEQAVVGNIRYDFINENRNKIQKKELGLLDSEKAILFDYYDLTDFTFYSFFSPDYCEKVLISLLRIIPKFSNATLIIKVHPLANPQRCRDFLRHFKPRNKAIILHKEDAMSLIPLCSAVISPGVTTLCIDTIANRVPFVAANFNKFPHIPFQGYKAFIEVFNERELEEVLEKIIHDQYFLEQHRQYFDEFISDFCYKLDGNSTNRFVSALEGLLEKQ